MLGKLMSVCAEGNEMLWKTEEREEGIGSGVQSSLFQLSSVSKNKPSKAKGELKNQTMETLNVLSYLAP